MLSGARSTFASLKTLDVESVARDGCTSVGR